MGKFLIGNEGVLAEDAGKARSGGRYYIYKRKLLTDSIHCWFLKFLKVNYKYKLEGLL